MMWIYLITVIVINFIITYYFLKLKNKYLILNLLCQVLVFFKSSDFLDLVIMSIVSIVLNLIGYYDDLYNKIENKYIILLLGTGILKMLQAPLFIKYKMLEALLYSIILFLFCIILEMILGKHVIGGGDLKLIIVLSLLVDNKIFLICFISVFIALIRKKKHNPLGVGFLTALFFI